MFIPGDKIELKSETPRLSPELNLPDQKTKAANKERIKSIFGKLGLKIKDGLNFKELSAAVLLTCRIKIIENKTTEIKMLTKPKSRSFKKGKKTAGRPKTTRIKNAGNFKTKLEIKSTQIQDTANKRAKI